MKHLKTAAILVLIVLLMLLSGCGGDVTFQLRNGECTIYLTEQTAANYEWTCAVSRDGIVQLEEHGLKTDTLGMVGFNASTFFRFTGLRAGDTDAYFSFEQTYENGSTSASTRLYELHADENGSITSCFQRAATVTTTDALCPFLRVDKDGGYSWNIGEYDENIMTVYSGGSERETDKSLPGWCWEYFRIVDKAEGVGNASFYMTDPDGEVVKTVTYEVHVSEDGTTTCRFFVPEEGAILK